MKQIEFLIMTIHMLFEDIGFANIPTANKPLSLSNEKKVYKEILQINRQHKMMNGNISGVIAWDSG